MSGLEDFQKNFISGLLADDKADSRLDVYRTIVAENHRSALSDTYPVCEQLVGPDYFKVLAWNYLLKFPTGEADLNLYGKDFPVFLGEWFTDYSPYNELLYLKDISVLEWAIYILQHAHENEEITVEVTCNVLEIWKAHQGDFEEFEKKKGRSMIVVKKIGEEIFAKTTPVKDQ